VCNFSVQSLSGHTTPIDAVKFNSSEDTVIAGSLSGALKIWDLESVKSKQLLALVLQNIYRYFVALLVVFFGKQDNLKLGR